MSLISNFGRSPNEGLRPKDVLGSESPVAEIESTLELCTLSFSLSDPFGGEFISYKLKYL